MSDKQNENEERNTQEVRIEDLPVDEATADEIKGGPGLADTHGSGSGSGDY